MEDYDEEPTQLATQQLPDHNGIAPSELTGQDYSNVIAFLHPCSTAAHVVVRLSSKRNPNMVAKLPTPEDKELPDNSEIKENAATHNGAATAIDLVLKKYPGPKDPSIGFLFGRNQMKCDVHLGDVIPNQLRISNQHFRIYVNAKGAVMLEDMSTNGTYVDGKLIGKAGVLGTKRVLSAGSTIHICPSGPGCVDELIRFVVRIPKTSGRGFQSVRPPGETGPLVGIDPGTPHPMTPPAQTRPGLLRSPQTNLANARRNPRLPQDMSLHNNSPRVMPRRANPPMDTHNPYQPIHTQWAGHMDYSMSEQIGKGAFASVCMAYERRTGEAVAVKVIAKRTFANNIGTDRAGVKKEVDILERLVHPNIVRYIRHYEDKTHVSLIMELVEGGDLNGYLEQHKQMEESLTKEVTMQMLRGVEYIHSMGISHRDIKPDNILIASQAPKFLIKISDFGLAKMVKNEETFLKTFCGTMLYLAPEVFPGYQTALDDKANEGTTKRKRLPHDDGGRQGKKPPRRPYNQAVDMWSLGCVVYALLCGSPPFAGKNQDEMCRLVVKGEFDEQRLRGHVGIDNDKCVDFIRQLLQVAPERRMMEHEAMKHPWVYAESSFRSYEEYAEDDIKGVFYNQQGHAVVDAAYRRQAFIDLDDDEDLESDDENLPPPQPPQLPREVINKELGELGGSLSEMNVGQFPGHDFTGEASSSSISEPEMFEPVAESAKLYSQPMSTGLSVIDRELQDSRRIGEDRLDSDVIPMGLSPFEPPFQSRPAQHHIIDSEYSHYATPVGVEDPNIIESDDGDSLIVHDPGSLHGADEEFNHINFVANSADPSAFTTPPPPDRRARKAVASFSFADEPAAVPNFSPESLKTRSPRTPGALNNRTPQQPSRLRMNAIASTFKPFTPDGPMPPVQQITSPRTALADTTNTTTFTRPYAPWGRVTVIPGSIPLDNFPTQISFLDQVIKFGRASNADYKPPDPRISKHHVAIQINYPNKDMQSDPLVSRIEGNWKPDQDMVVMINVKGRCGVWVNGKVYKAGTVVQLCHGDELLLFKDASRNEFFGFKVELFVGLVHPDQRMDSGVL
ncbi:Pkinase-domain-containing protein [Ascodesmis nigricans]|uniref:Pkinase-domain-containing protein n=1 Tax=Ascodesmis nigricans TaxID=341454 RepID=A0A4S2MUB3_9PEZI|nr:Pkinase-domain-containing protein [Ascodesmis nigricans]